MVMFFSTIYRKIAKYIFSIRNFEHKKRRYRVATTHCPCFLPDLGEFMRSKPYRRCKDTAFYLDHQSKFKKSYSFHYLCNMRLRSENLIKQYGSKKVVNDVSVEVNQGEIVGLLGPNGAGKTTTFYMCVGLVKPDKGKIYLDDKDITKLPMYKRAQLGIGYLPQEASVFRDLSVEDNIKAILEMTKLTKIQQEEKLETLIEEFGLGRVRTNLGKVLSGGERRRTEIARALATDPYFILLDEPFAGVDPIAVEDIQSIVAKLKDRNIGILITDHNVQETLSITDRAYLLFEGQLLKQGNAEELANDELVRKVYLGQNFELRRKSPKQKISE